MVLHRNELIQYLQNYKHHYKRQLTKVILESSYIVLQDTPTPKTLKRTVCFLKAVEFWATFDIQIDITFKEGSLKTCLYSYQ